MQPKVLNTVILFVDLVNSVSISNQIGYIEYDALINEFQACMYNSVRTFVKIGSKGVEARVSGDQLSLFYYNPDEANFKVHLGKDITHAEPDFIELQERVFTILKLAIKLKLNWQTTAINLQRLKDQRKPYEIGIGIHVGPCVYNHRCYEKPKIEGYAINFAKRIESFSRFSKYSHIVVSKSMFEIINQAVRGNLLLSQRIFWHRHFPSDSAALKGLQDNLVLFELKYYHRVKGISELSENEISTFEEVFNTDPSNLWICNLLNVYYGFRKKDWERVYEFSNTALMCHGPDEKLFIDIGKACSYLSKYDLAEQFYKKALKINPYLDLALEGLFAVYDKRGEPICKKLSLVSEIISNTPRSPHFLKLYADTLEECGRIEEAEIFKTEALRISPNMYSEY